MSGAQANVQSSASRLKTKANLYNTREAKWYREALDEYKSASKQYETAKYRAELALQTYYKTPMGRIQQAKDIGEKIVNKILSILPKKKEEDNSKNAKIETMVRKNGW